MDRPSGRKGLDDRVALVELAGRVKVTTLGASPDGDEYPLPQTSSKYFSQDEIGALPRFFEDELNRSAGLLMIIFENWQSWAYDAVRAAIPRFPSKLLLEVSGNLSLVMLPLFDDGNRECCYITDHIDISENPGIRYSPGSMRMGQWGASREPIATWTRQTGAFAQSPDRPVVVIFGTEGISDKLGKHYLSEGRRWERLDKCPYWTYLDTFYVFTNWDSTLEVARLNLENKEQGLFNREAKGSIVHQTRELHRDASTTLSLQESIRLHQASLRHFQLGLGRLPQSDALDFLLLRLEDVSQQLDYYAGTSVTILEQQKNLLSLRFNLENITQSQAVARLNALAFVFLPLSFVAAIFGITTFETPASWYPVAAIPVLLVTVGIAFGINRATAYLESRQLNNPRSLHPELEKNVPSYTQPTPISSSHKAGEAPRINTTGDQGIGSSSASASNKKPSPPYIAVEDLDSDDLKAQPTSPSSSRRVIHTRESRVERDHRDSEYAVLERRWRRREAQVQHEGIDSDDSQPDAPRVSSMALGYRVRGVARVDSGHLRPDLYADAAPGALRSPSGTLRHF